MRPEDFLDFSEPGAIRIKGHRIGLEHIVEAYQEGETPAQIVAYYSTLSLDEVNAAIAYYHAHSNNVDAYLARLDEAQAEQLRTYQPAPILRRMAQLLDKEHQAREGEDATQVPH
ncbi:MAG: DUF433 domain-containing protein [Ktedonobacterales bacterium]